MRADSPSRPRSSGWACGLPSGVALLLALVMGGCRLVGGGGTGAPEALPVPQGERAGEESPTERLEPEPPPTMAPSWVEPTSGVVYQGRLELDGGEMAAAIQLVRHGRRDVWGVLQGGTNLEAEGPGTLRGETLELDLRYGGECPGRLVLTGRWDQEGGSFSGVVQATDCTGPAEGSFRFSWP